MIVTLTLILPSFCPHFEGCPNIKLPSKSYPHFTPYIGVMRVMRVS